jgi:DNA-binding response OmpR family regulator
VNLVAEEKILSKVVLIVDDEPDWTTDFSLGLQDESFEVYTYNDLLEALSQFRMNFYDLILIDINMPKINGIEITRQILELDANVNICFVTAVNVNMKALGVHRTRSIGCYIKDPVIIAQLVRRAKAEIE